MFLYKSFVNVFLFLLWSMLGPMSGVCDRRTHVRHKPPDDSWDPWEASMLPQKRPLMRVVII